MKFVFLVEISILSELPRQCAIYQFLEISQNGETITPKKFIEHQSQKNGKWYKFEHFRVANKTLALIARNDDNIFTSTLTPYTGNNFIAGFSFGRNR